MIDPFVLLAPLLLLPIVALLRFIGCAAILGVDDVQYASDATVVVDPPPGPLYPGRSMVFRAHVTLTSAGTPLEDVSWSSDDGLIDPVTGSYTAPMSISNNKTVIIRATSTHYKDANGNDSVGLATVRLKPFPLRVNCGPLGMVPDTDGLGPWAADFGFSGSTKTHSVPNSIIAQGGTGLAPDQDLYRSCRTGDTPPSSFSYNLPTGLTGDVIVTLKFAAITATRPVFNVTINNAPKLTPYDLVMKAAGTFRARDEVIQNVSVTSGMITITFSQQGTAGVPIINAIEIKAPD